MFLVTNFKAVSVCTFKYHKFGFAKILNDTWSNLLKFCAILERKNRDRIEVRRMCV